MPPTQPQLDTQAVALAKSIRRNESQDNFNAKGKLGEWGAYQFRPDTWNAYAQEAGVNAPFGQATPDQQNEVAYKKIKQWKDQGYNVGQIASMWNAGPGKANAYVEGHSGTNQGVQYDTQAYAKRVAETYQVLKSEQQLANNSQLKNQQGIEKEQSFLKDVGDTTQETYQGFKEALGKGKQGDIAPVSAALQGAGAIAGGINQLTTDVLHHTPIVGGLVKNIEGKIGEGAQRVLETDIGKKAISGYQKYAQEHPEAAANIGAATNIAMAVPVVKGLAATKGAIQRGVSSALKGSYDDIVSKALQTIPKSSEVGPGIKGGLIQEGKYGPELMPDPLKQSSTKYLTQEMEASSFPKTSSDTRIARFADNAGDAEAENLTRMLKESEIQNIVQPDDLAALQEQVLKRAGDTLVTGDKPAQTLLEVFYKNLPKDREILPVDVLTARRAVGQFIRANRGDWNMRGVYTGFKSARDAFWDESRTLLQRLAPDVDVLGSLEKQSALYRVIDYMKPKVLQELKNTEYLKSSFLNRHPVVKGLLKTGGKYALEGLGLGAGYKLLSD